MDLKSVIDTRRRGEPDIVLFVIILLLAGIGIAMSYSASAVVAARTFGDSFHFLKRQAAWFVLGFAALFLIQQFDYRNYIRYTKIMLFVSLVLLVLVLIPGVGHSVKGSAAGWEADRSASSRRNSSKSSWSSIWRRSFRPNRKGGGTRWSSSSFRSWSSRSSSYSS